MPASNTAASPSAWVVHKFGGSSVADADCFRRVAAILDAQPPGRLGVVLSACKGITDALLGLVAQAEKQDPDYRRSIESIRARHAAIAGSLLDAEAARLYLAAFDRDCHDIEGILHTVRLTRSAARNVVDLIAGYGEIWSTRLFRELLRARQRRAAGRRAAGSTPARRCWWSGVRWGPACSGTSRAGADGARWCRPSSSARWSSPASSPRTATASRRRSAATAAISRRRSSARCSTPPRS